MVLSNRYLIVLLLCGMMAQINCVPVYCGLFAMNRKAIAEKACEKRVKDCCGSCFLHKKIASAQETQPSTDGDAPTNKSRSDIPELMPGLEPVDHLIQRLTPEGMMLTSESSLPLPSGYRHPIDYPPENPHSIPAV
jgi:hypothetical protein